MSTVIRYQEWPKNVVLSVHKGISQDPASIFFMAITYVLSGSKEHIPPLPLRAALPVLALKYPEKYDLLPSSYNPPRFRERLMIAVRSKCSGWSVVEAQMARIYFKKLWTVLIICRSLLGPSTEIRNRVRFICKNPVYLGVAADINALKEREKEVLFDFDNQITKMLLMADYQKIHDDEDGLEQYDEDFELMINTHCRKSKKKKAPKIVKLTPNRSRDKNKKNDHNLKRKRNVMDDDDDKDNDNKNDEDVDFGFIENKHDNNNHNKNNVGNNDNNKYKKNGHGKGPYVVSAEELSKWVEIAKKFGSNHSVSLIELTIKHCEGEDEDIVDILFQ